MTVIESLKSQLREKNAIPFFDYMQQALYAPELGFYSSALPKFGKEGDFVTAPELTPLFGQTIANQCAQVLETLTDPIIFEFGAGSGKCAVDILKRLQTLDALPSKYVILELSGHLRQRQEAFIKEQIPHLFSRVQWLHAWPKTPFEGVILANEILDAMPVHRFLQTETGLLESYVVLNQAGELEESYKPCQNEALLSHVKRVLPANFYPYQSEANLLLEPWFKACEEMLKKGAFFILDYGFPRHEYYHPDRNMGTLMCHYKHQSHANPLAHPGLEDITAHVDFTHAAEAADMAGFQIEGYCNQASFLIANGLLSLVEEINDPIDLVNSTQAVKKLLQASEMGELFKVLAVSKGLSIDLQGFQMQNRLASL